MATIADVTEPDHDLLLAMEMDVDVFASDWGHCDRIATYVGRMVGHTRRDPLLYANLFSSALNELLETVFRFHAPHGRLFYSVARAGDIDRIRLRLPCSEVELAFYHEAVGKSGAKSAGEIYHEALMSTDPLDPFTGILELAVDYAAVVSVEEHEDNSLSLVADLALEAGNSS